ncbi:MAG: hypothetical protein RL336_1066 [Pseudomonadota bacterium]
MSEHSSRIEWMRGDSAFSDDSYTRGHRWVLDGGIEVTASSAPGIPNAVEAAIDPEEGVLSSLSSCHMLFFLALAMRKNFIVDAYTDQPSGVIDRNAMGKKAFVAITMRPEAHFSGDTLPTREDIDTLHARAHSLCFVANSLNADIAIEPIYPSE